VALARRSARVIGGGSSRIARGALGGGWASALGGVAAAALGASALICLIFQRRQHVSRSASARRVNKWHRRGVMSAWRRVARRLVSASALGARRRRRHLGVGGVGA